MWARFATRGSGLCPCRGSLSNRVQSCGASFCRSWADLALQSGPGPWVKLLRLPSGPSLAPQPQIHRSRVSGSAPSYGPRPTATPAPLWTHGHGNFSHPTCHLAQHGHPMPWAPPAPTPLGGQVSWAGRLSQLQQWGPRVILAPSLPTASPVALGTGGTWSLRPSSLKGQQTTAGSASHTGQPGHCPQLGDLSRKESSGQGQLAPERALRQKAPSSRNLFAPSSPWSIHQPAFPVHGGRGRPSRARPSGLQFTVATGSKHPASSKFYRSSKSKKKLFSSHQGSSTLISEVGRSLEPMRTAERERAGQWV